MIAFAWLLLLAASSRVELVNYDYQIAAADWQWVPVGLKQKPGTISAHFHVKSGDAQVRLVLMPGEYVDDMPLGSLAQTERGRTGDLHYYVQNPGEYGVVVDNREGATAASVHLSVWIDFSRPRAPVETVPPQRQLTVIVLSFAAFFGIVSWSARRLLRAVRK